MSSNAPQGQSRSGVVQLCARAELAHVRVLNVIRIPEGAVGGMAT
jgi:hypothetical protein